MKRKESGERVRVGGRMSGERGECESWSAWEVESERGIEKEQGEEESVGGRERGWRE